MASSLISRSHHIYFDSVFRFDDAEIVQMFESLVTTGLMEFLGCPAIFHEHALIEFFANGSVKDGMVLSTIGGTAVEISESVFAATFGLPTEGLTDLSEVPRNLLSEAQSLFSASEKEVSISCLKKEIKMQYRLLSDILAKSLFVKAGSFDAWSRIDGVLLSEIQKGFVALSGFIDRWTKSLNSRRFELKNTPLAIAITETLKKNRCPLLWLRCCFPSFITTKDAEGHGSHTSSIAAGNYVKGTSFYCYANGNSREVPAVRIAACRVCYPDLGCDSEDILAAFDDAVADGVDIITVSLGKLSQLDCVLRTAPGIFPAAASTTDRASISKVVLGNGTIITISILLSICYSILNL
ncbi:cucumisin-like [Dorcoceras hygrometricum]|uniref:Cucumisin-like n=1 Tax=Dorcoceras hygrometricum TaxID=472368 RepID=A0A2Z7AYJ3_9LAMI|nr:cucumisin-like [Dorcoceras hygrometricum]